VVAATWEVINQAKKTCAIDNAGDHIGQAIRWVLARERAKA
jgi:hypothetical protein